MLRCIFFLMCLLQFRHSVFAAVTPKPIIVNGTYINPELGKYHARLRTLAQSCLDIKEKYNVSQDGIYFLTTESGSVYQTFCDMTTAGGGWTLVASVHENNLNGRCSLGDRWSSQQGNDQHQPEGDGTWANTDTFGTAEGSTSDDYKNPGYYEIPAKDVSVWHVPNKELLKNWMTAAILRYHTESQFLSEHGGSLYNLFKKYPVKFAAGDCKTDMGPSSPVLYDTGDKDSTADLYGPSARKEFESGFITFRVFNTDKAAMAMCSGVKPTGCNPQHYCIGGGGFFPERNQCGDFTALDGSSDGTQKEMTASKEMIESAVLLFYR
ncbi:intelectin-like [Myxocyprinus asiaticus]|uniref:intelectin-like n=1 Tax=Myxocyprinus asiaticus TaxID=70543 RepID=UPI00222201CC|nr:intelectin-like [Myxocyprinus asiaticus]